MTRTGAVAALTGVVLTLTLAAGWGCRENKTSQETHRSTTVESSPEPVVTGDR